MRFASIILACCIALASAGARADVIVLKNGVRIEVEKVFDLAGAYYYVRDGELLSVSGAEVHKIEKDAPDQAAPVKAALPTQTQTQTQTCEATGPDEEDQAREDFLYIRQCRYAMSAEAKKTNNDFKASCSRALRMIERMYEGKLPNDGSFGYHLDFLSNPLMWEVLSPDESARLKSVVFQKDGPVDEFIGPYKERMKALKFKETFALAKAAEAHEELVRQQEAAYRATHNAQTRWTEEVERRLAAANGCVSDGDGSDVNFGGSHAGLSGGPSGSGSKSSKSISPAKAKKHSSKPSSGSGKKSSKSSSSSSSSSGGGGGGGHHRSGGT